LRSPATDASSASTTAGQFAVRGGIVDVFPTTGPRAARVEFFGDEIESVRRFSPFTQRALHPVDEATLYPGRGAGRSTHLVTTCH
jgi:transcription-repair coupling factor (superfamily II helicase)